MNVTFEKDFAERAVERGATFSVSRCGKALVLSVARAKDDDRAQLILLAFGAREAIALCGELMLHASRIVEER